MASAGVSDGRGGEGRRDDGGVPRKKRRKGPAKRGSEGIEIGRNISEFLINKSHN